MKRVSFGAKPPAAPSPATADAWVANTPAAAPATPPEPIKRLTIDIPLGLHRRMRTAAALEGVYISDVVRDFLDRRFPAPGHDGTTAREGGGS